MIRKITTFTLYTYIIVGTLSSHQKKLQEAKFEMLTSEASYLNSLNVLIDHFIKNLKDCDFLKSEEHEVLFGKVHSGKWIARNICDHINNSV